MSISANLSVAELERALAQRKREVKLLQAKRQKMSAALAKLDARIARLEGSVAVPSAVGRLAQSGGRRPRAKNARTLADVLAGVLQADKAMTIAEIVDGAKKAGYKSNAANFRLIVNQTLLKDKRFKKTGFGLYKLVAEKNTAGKVRS